MHINFRCPGINYILVPRYRWLLLMQVQIIFYPFYSLKKKKKNMSVIDLKSNNTPHFNRPLHFILVCS